MGTFELTPNSLKVQKMLIRVPFLLILTWIDQVSRKCVEGCTYSLVIVTAAATAVVLSLILVRKKFKGSSGPAPTTTITDAQANCQNNLTRSIVQEIKSIDDNNTREHLDCYSIVGEDEEEEENAQNQQEQRQGTQDSDSGVGTVTFTTPASNCSISSPVRISRWQELIEEGEVLNRQLFDLAEPKEWVRKKRLVFGILPATDEAASSMSPMTKHLFRRK